MGKCHYEMKTDKPQNMNEQQMLQLSSIHFAPYIQLATALIGKARHAGGNMFRHQMDTFAILLDYGYIDPVLLKASIIHDTIEDIPGFIPELITNADEDGAEVLKLVREVTRQDDESKKEFLCRILNDGSQQAKILKCADRISNMISLGFVTDPAFIERYCDETEYFILPMAIQVDFPMYQELIDLIITRRRYLEDGGYFDNRTKPTTSADSTK